MLGPSGEGFPVESKKIEEPGRYFHPLLATLITGRPDSCSASPNAFALRSAWIGHFAIPIALAIAKPDDMGESEFIDRARSICDWFSPLNPYEKKGPIFKIEDANYPISGEAKRIRRFEPLYCYCISAKRYVLFNRRTRRRNCHSKGLSASAWANTCRRTKPMMRRNSIPTPALSLNDIGVDRWQYDLWHKIIQAALDGHPDQVDLPYHDAMKRPAVSRYGATTPALLKWFETFNSGREYPDRVKPFNFLNAFHARPQFELSDADQWAMPKRGRPRKQLDVKPIAAFNRNASEAAKGAFDRETGKPISA